MDANQRECRNPLILFVAVQKGFFAIRLAQGPEFIEGRMQIS